MHRPLFFWSASGGAPWFAERIFHCIGLWRAASVENYPYPVVTSWSNVADKIQSIALQGEPVILTGRHFDRVKSVCVNDVDVAMPPVWRVSVKLIGNTIPEDANVDSNAEATVRPALTSRS
jgi:hypothetical protein